MRSSSDGIIAAIASTPFLLLLGHCSSSVLASVIGPRKQLSSSGGIYCPGPVAIESRPAYDPEAPQPIVPGFSFDRNTPLQDLCDASLHPDNVQCRCVNGNVRCALENLSLVLTCQRRCSCPGSSSAINVSDTIEAGRIGPPSPFDARFGAGYPGDGSGRSANPIEALGSCPAGTTEIGQCSAQAGGGGDGSSGSNGNGMPSTAATGTSACANGTDNNGQCSVSPSSQQAPAPPIDGPPQAPATPGDVNTQQAPSPDRQQNPPSAQGANASDRGQLHPPAAGNTGNTCRGSCSSAVGCSNDASCRCHGQLVSTAKGTARWIAHCVARALSNSLPRRDLSDVTLGEAPVCPCNSSYVSAGCCDVLSGIIWEHPSLNLGSLIDGEEL